ncbi:hypothetical protein [Streptomyces sp. NPDC014685]|uniref:hypothetical protein n=1 Tax=Streptomyces sp. NPDC014685 TaxID=3364881 RepID=UPI0037017E0E
MSLTALRAPAVQHLLTLRAEPRLTRAHVHTTAQCLNVSDRTVWRWLAEATTTPATAAAPGARRTDRFEITPELRVLLAYWHGNASAVHRGLLDDGADPATARLATVLGQPVEEIERRKTTPLSALDFTFRAQASLIVLWMRGDARTRRIIERAIAKTLRRLEDEVAETRWPSGLVIAKWCLTPRHRRPAPGRRGAVRSNGLAATEGLRRPDGDLLVLNSAWTEVVIWRFQPGGRARPSACSPLACPVPCG